MEVKPIVGMAIILLGGALLVIAAVRARGASGEVNDRRSEPVQCHECIGSHDPSCVSSCGMPS
jgi:hypothetical protein